MEFRKHRVFRLTAAVVTLSVLVVASMPAKSLAYVVSSGALERSGAVLEARHGDMDKIQRVLESKMVARRLMELGLTNDEVDSRLSRLSDAELHSFAARVDSLYPGGNGLGFLVGLLLVFLIVLIILKAAGKTIVIK